jgi:hypothetical protein
MAVDQNNSALSSRNFIFLTIPIKDQILPPFTVTTRDGKVLSSVEEVTEHLLRADRLSDAAFDRLLHDLDAE